MIELIVILMIGLLVAYLFSPLLRSEGSGSAVPPKPHGDAAFRQPLDPVINKRAYFERSAKDSKPKNWYLPEEFVVFDLETTGFSPKASEIIEFGAIRVSRDFSSKKTFQCLVRIDKEIPRKIEELTGISEKMLENEGIEPHAAIGGFMDFIGDLPLVAFNAKFDKSFLHAAALKHGIEVRNEFHCALELARRAWPDRSSYKLADISADGGLDNEGLHRALGDCGRALMVYIVAMKIIHNPQSP